MAFGLHRVGDTKIPQPSMHGEHLTITMPAVAMESQISESNTKGEDQEQDDENAEISGF